MVGNILDMSQDFNPALGSTPSIQLFRIITTLASHLRTRMDQRLAEIGLTTQQAAVLSIIEAADEPPTLGQVATLLGSTHQNSRQIVNALERKGFLEVTVDAVDRRVRRLHLGPDVKTLFAQRNPSDHREVGQWLAVLSEDEQRQAVGLLHRVLAELT